AGLWSNQPSRATNASTGLFFFFFFSGMSCSGRLLAVRLCDDPFVLKPTRRGVTCDDDLAAPDAGAILAGGLVAIQQEGAEVGSVVVAEGGARADHLAGVVDGGAE